MTELDAPGGITWDYESVLEEEPDTRNLPLPAPSPHYHRARVRHRPLRQRVASKGKP